MNNKIWNTFFGNKDRFFTNKSKMTISYTRGVFTLVVPSNISWFVDSCPYTLSKVNFLSFFSFLFKSRIPCRLP